MVFQYKNFILLKPEFKWKENSSTSKIYPNSNPLKLNLSVMLLQPRVEVAFQRREMMEDQLYDNPRRKSLDSWSGPSKKLCRNLKRTLSSSKKSRP